MMKKVESFDMIARKAIAYGYVYLFTNNLCLPEIFISAAICYSSGKGKLLAEINKSILVWDNYLGGL